MSGPDILHVLLTFVVSFCSGYSVTRLWNWYVRESSTQEKAGKFQEVVNDRICGLPARWLLHGRSSVLHPAKEYEMTASELG